MMLHTQTHNTHTHPCVCFARDLLLAVLIASFTAGCFFYDVALWPAVTRQQSERERKYLLVSRNVISRSFEKQLEQCCFVLFYTTSHYIKQRSCSPALRPHSLLCQLWSTPDFFQCQWPSLLLSYWHKSARPPGGSKLQLQKTLIICKASSDVSLTVFFL